MDSNDVVYTVQLRPFKGVRFDVGSSSRQRGGSTARQVRLRARQRQVCIRVPGCRAGWECVPADQGRGRI